jgi:outer membrane protein OmpA-like peptidoglycan-associated protein
MPAVLNEKKNALVAIAVSATVAFVMPAAAQQTRTISGERYSPTIWVDPDGCEHWVMDDGAEGYMTPHVMPDGKPVCRQGQLCGMMPTDQFFATDKHYINSAHRQRIVEFFEKTRGNTRAYVIAGHTDSRASDEYNIALSQRRANAVAKIARSVSGVRVADVRAYGERDPRKPNTSAQNMAENRRVEIYCLR